jgi:hypothetical protein
MDTSAIEIPRVVTDKWQEITNLLAELVQVPAALVMRVEPPEISVFVSSKHLRPRPQAERLPRCAPQAAAATS